jgi:hypothetical protein
MEIKLQFNDRKPNESLIYGHIFEKDNIPELSRTCTFLIFKIGRMQPFIKATTTTQNGDGNYE